jgi:hypothetical protein
MTPDLAAQVRNVLRGRSAYGFAGIGSMPFPHDPAALAALVKWTGNYISVAKGPDDLTRSRFIRKLAHFITRNGHDDAYQQVLLDGVIWFSDHPRAVTSKLSFAGAARLRAEAVRAETNATDVIATKLMRAAMLVPEPPCPVLLEDGPFSLLQLVHPMHLMRAGRSANNCLWQMVKGGDIPNPRYWQAIAEDDLQVFAISMGIELCCLFAVREQAYTEWEYVALPAGLDAFVAECLAAMERLMGPLVDALSFVIVQGEIVTPGRRRAYHPIPPQLLGGHRAGI